MSDVVSSFELIFKPQSPEPVNDGEPVATVLQGYFLSISNLTDEAYRYALRFRIAEPGDPTRSLTDNTVVIIDVPDENNTFTRLRSFDGESFFIDSGSIRIPGHGTALVAVLPQVFGPVPGDPTPIPSPNFEVRGYVEISLPTIRVPIDVDGFGGRIGLPQAQSADPVPTLLTPQYRATYFDADEVITDQTQSTVPVGAGAGMVQIAPDQPFFGIPDDLRLPPFAGFIDGLDERAKAAMLTTLLTGLDPDDGVKRMNRILKAADAKIELKGD
jgi:hypothetical protein